MLSFSLLKSKTFWGAIAAAAGLLLNAAVIDTTVILQAIGIVVGAIGLRDAIESRKQ